MDNVPVIVVERRKLRRRTKQGFALRGRNRTGPPCSVGRSVGPPARRQRYRRRQMTPTDDRHYRQQRAKQYWPIRRASNK